MRTATHAHRWLLMQLLCWFVKKEVFWDISRPVLTKNSFPAMPIVSQKRNPSTFDSVYCYPHIWIFLSVCVPVFLLIFTTMMKVLKTSWTFLKVKQNDNIYPHMELSQDIFSLLIHKEHIYTYHWLLLVDAFLISVWKTLGQCEVTSNTSVEVIHKYMICLATRSFKWYLTIALAV